MLFPLVFVWIYVSLNEATFSDNFRTFLRLNFGTEAEKNLSRVDVGPGGSFGGGNHTALLPTNKVPVIFIHGNGGSAAAMVGNRNYFIANGGYTDDEVYATTYGNLTVDSIRCEYLKSLRRLIIAVNRYCGFKKVNVFGHSRGVPNTRKAILGGKCVDSGEELGPSLTNIVLNYVSLAGSNRGALYCVGQETPSCNSLNGVQPGSAAINDINSKVHYEGMNTFALLSKADTVAGYEYNGIILTELPGANKTYTYDNLSHGQVSSDTYATQLNIVNGQI